MGYIATLRGILKSKAPADIVVECGGVGYAVTVPLSTFDRLPATGQETELLIRHVIREEDQQLFGFATDRERSVFVTLTAVSGIGPKLALNVLSALTPSELAAAVSGNDIKRLSSISGIGKKTAERIVVELRDKINPLEAAAARGDPLLSGGEEPASAAMRDAILSLVALGNRPEDARLLVQKAYEVNPEATVQELIRAALRK